jgi:small subunit ribosomal protein S5
MIEERKEEIKTKKETPLKGRRGFKPRGPKFLNTNEGSPDEEEWQSRMIDLRRVTRVMAGGKRFKFRACVVVGNGRGKVGVATAKGSDVAQAISKASYQAKRKAVQVPMVRETIPHEVRFKCGSAEVLLKPAPPGAGIIAGGAVRTVMNLAGIHNISGKIISRSSNKVNNARAAIGALKQLKSPKTQVKTEPKVEAVKV